MSAEPVPLGKLLRGDELTDAVHIAISPVIADEELAPGQEVGFSRPDSIQYVSSKSGKPIGIIDPFLPQTVKVGQCCYMCLFPNTVTSLRHQWEHPAFLEHEREFRESEVGQAKTYLSEVCKEFELEYDEFLEVLKRSHEDGDTHCLPFDTPDIAWEKYHIEKIWEAYETVTGEDVSADDKSTLPFRCAC